MGFHSDPVERSGTREERTVFYLSGYQGAAVWFAPLPIFDHGGVVPQFKQLPGGGSLIEDIIKWPYIFTGLGCGSAFYLLLAAARAPTILFYGFIGGLGTFPHFAFPQFAGALLGRYYFRKRFGESRWRAYAPILLAGYSCGMGLIGMTSVGVVLISKAVSQIVY